MEDPSDQVWGAGGRILRVQRGPTPDRAGISPNSGRGTERSKLAAGNQQIRRSLPVSAHQRDRGRQDFQDKWAVKAKEVSDYPEPQSSASSSHNLLEIPSLKRSQPFRSFNLLLPLENDSAKGSERPLDHKNH